MKWIIFLFIFSLNKNTISTITRQHNSSDELLKHEIVPMKERHEDDFELDGNSHGNEKIKIFVGTFNGCLIKKTINIKIKKFSKWKNPIF